MCRLILCSLLLGFALPAFSQIGDKSDHPGEVQKSLVPRDQIPPAPVLSPADALKSFKVQPGFHVECVASEPLVQDPVLAQFDPDGRLWVVEMRGYMPDLDGNGEDAPVGRIIILSDSKHDGHYDSSTTFLDGLVLPRALTFVGGGVLVGAPPHLWYCRDTNGDGRADVKIEIASDFGVAVDPKRPELANPERAPNTLTWGMDNWIYSTAYLTRYRYHKGDFLHTLTSFRGQWGLTEDDRGRLFYDSNSDELRYDALPSYYLSRNPNYLHPAGINVNAVANQLCWPARVNPGINRGYREASLRNGRLKEFTAACSPFALYSDLFPPDFYGNIFIADPAGNLVRRNTLIQTNGAVYATNAYDQAEFLASTDERFRPVNFTCGPDGALYIVDMHHGVIEHRISLTSYLREQSSDRGLDKPLHTGRIFRVIPDGKSLTNNAHFSRETPLQWVDHLSSPDKWWRMTAQRLLVETNSPATIPALTNLALSGIAPLGRLHALWTLDGMNALDQSTLDGALTDSDSRVRAAAIRLHEPLLATEERDEALGKILALTNDAAPDVQLQLAATLGEAHDKTADLALANLARTSGSNVFLLDVILSGLHGRELDLLHALSSDAAWKNPVDRASSLVRGLSACVVIERNPQRVADLLALAQGCDSPALQRLILDGMISTRVVTSRKPVKLPVAPAALTALENNPAPEISKLAHSAAELLTWSGKPGAPVEKPLPPLTAAEQLRFDQGKKLFQGTCAACHQLHGMGMEGLAPPLADSEWVLGSEQRLVRIVLKGVQGPIKVCGHSYYLDMPSMGVFDDDQIAAILTYIRREWDNTGSPVDPATVKAIHLASAKRQESWSADELLKIH